MVCFPWLFTILDFVLNFLFLVEMLFYNLPQSIGHLNGDGMEIFLYMICNSIQCLDDDDNVIS